MKPDWIRKMASMPARQLHLMGGGLIAIAAAALWFYALRAPLASLRALHAEQASLQAAAGDPRLLAAQLAALDKDTETLARRVGGAAAHTATQQAVGLLGEIGVLARDHAVKLHAATPAPEEQLMSFTQVGFDAEASGSYAALLSWIRAIEASPSGLSVASFTMHAAATPGQVDMKIRIAAFRPQETKQ